MARSKKSLVRAGHRRKTVAPQDLVSPSLEMSASSGLCSAFRILILRLVNFYREREG